VEHPLSLPICARRFDGAAPSRRDIADLDIAHAAQSRGIAAASMPFEVLHGTLVFLRGRAGLEGAQVPAFAGFRSLLARIEAVVTRFQLANHCRFQALSRFFLVVAGNMSQLGAYVGYMRPYATSHNDLDKDTAFQEEVRNAARSLVAAFKQLRRGKLNPTDAGLRAPRQK